MRYRVAVAALRFDDAAEFVAASKASRKLHAPWVSAPLTTRVFRTRLKRMQARDDLAFTIRRVDNRALVGYVELTNVVRGVFLSAYIGYYAFTGHERQGLMREGLKVLARHAFVRLGLHRLEANIQPDNVASIALVRNCGFEREGYSRRYLKIRGRWRDHERWALLAS